MAARPYQRLPGRGSGLLCLITLWEGQDHLLFTESFRVSESYKRFFYRDIQAIVICQTKTGLILSIVPGLLALILGVLAAISKMEFAIPLGIFAGIMLLVALANIVLGPTCQCELRTAVQTQKLSSLSRIRRARKVLRRIQPKIAAAQETPASP